MQLCDYGCDKEAKYQFKNGKWCCSYSFNKCIRNKETNRQSHLGEKNHRFGKKNSLFNREQTSKANKGHIPWNKDKKDCYSKNTLEKMSKGHLGKKPWNKGMAKKRKLKSREEKSKNISIARRRTIKYFQKKYPTFAKVEEMRYEPGKEKEKVIQVHCKNHNCKNSKEQGGWFTPINREKLMLRIYAIEGDKENSYFYCSEDCKDECPLYGKKVITLIKQDQINAGHIQEPLYNPSEYQTFRQQVLEREKYICEYCDDKATDVHHSRPQKLEPGFVLDPDFGVACCKKCHYEYGHKTGTECSIGNLANKVCV